MFIPPVHRPHGPSDYLIVHDCNQCGIPTVFAKEPQDVALLAGQVPPRHVKPE
jgi:hypothetical protein